MFHSNEEKSPLENHYELIVNAFQHSTDAMLITDLNGTIIEINQAFTDIFGWSRDEAIGKSTNILRSRKIKDDFYKKMWKSINQKGQWKGEIINKRKDGSEIPILLSITPLYKEGEKIGHMGVEIDITEKKKIENQLRKERKFSESIIETANNLIVGLNLNGEIILFNRKCEQVIGYSQSEVLGRNWFESFVPKHLRRNLTEAFGSITEGQSSTQNETPILTRNGGERLIAWSNTVLRNEKHEITGALGIGQDITEQKNLEKQILQSERLAIIGKMAAKVAHEVRNPLSSISLNAELLEDEIRSYESINTDEVKSLLKSMIREIDRVSALTDEYLQFSRMPESRPLKGKFKELIDEIMEFLGSEFKQKNIKFEFNDSKPPFEVRIDRTQFRRVLINIIRNGIESMPNGGKLKIWTEKTEQNGVINIKDTGFGIPEEKINQIFDPFFTTKDFGTGLGLAISQQIIHEHGGQIYCKSKLGHGATFTIEIPLDKN